MRFFVIVLLGFLFYAQSILSTVLTGSLIKTCQGLVRVEELSLNNRILGCNDRSLFPCEITNIGVSQTNKIAKITTVKGVFYASLDQLFFDTQHNCWIKVEDISIDTIFLDSKMNHIECLAIDIINTKPIKLYHISTSYPHTFFVTDQELLTHNNPPIVVINLFWVFGEGVKIALGALLGGTFLGVQLYKNKEKDVEYAPDIQIGTYGGYNPDPDKDKKDIFENIKLKSDKKLRHRNFGNFYRDPETKLWWSKDRAGHGNVKFKVFKARSKGLEWFFDADEMGRQIIGKHKGPIGLFIKFKDLIRCQ